MKKSEKQLDNSLIERAQRGDEAAEETLLEKYKPLVRARARELFLTGGDQDDLLQEGMLGLFKAIRHYDPGKEASFATYARLLITRQIYNAITDSQRYKHQVLNTSVPLTDIEGQQDGGVMGAAESPENIVLDLENTRELREQIYGVLSPMEREVLDMYLEGDDYLRIAARMNRPAKSIDNALQRIRGKVSGIVMDGRHGRRRGGTHGGDR